MKTFCMLCICFIGFISHTSAQKIVVDSSFANAYKKTPNTTVKEQPPVEEKIESFGNLVEKIGEGIWTRLKYRLNLEGVQESLEAKKEKYTGGRDEEEEEKTGS